MLSRSLRSTLTIEESQRWSISSSDNFSSKVARPSLKQWSFWLTIWYKLTLTSQHIGVSGPRSPDFSFDPISNVLIQTRANRRFVSLACSIYVLFSDSFSTLLSTWCFELDILTDFCSGMSACWTCFQTYRACPRSDASGHTYFIQGSNRFWKTCDKDIWHNDKNNIRIISMQKPYFLRL